MELLISFFYFCKKKFLPNVPTPTGQRKITLSDCETIVYIIKEREETVCHHDS
jgi:hypothetical protein